jgi:adenylosuccinate synthase
MRNLIAVSGPIAVGKSSVISWLETRFFAIRVSTRAIIQSLRDVPSDRRSLQEAGDALDGETGGKWVADALGKWVHKSPADAIIVVDSVRIGKQVDHLRQAFGDKVWHVHLTASNEVLAKRFDDRKKLGDPAVREFATYQEVRDNTAEANIEQLGNIANVRIVTDRLEPGSVATLATEKLKLFATRIKPLVDVVVGGQYGSEGKGNICDFIAGEYDVLVRVGGPNAGHRVAAPPYDYIHMPSGTGGNPKAKILIGAGTTLDVVRVFKEIYDLGLDTERLSIDPQAIVIEQSDRDLERRLAKQIGSTQKGVGIATARKIVGRGEYKENSTSPDGPVFGARVRLVRDVPELKPFTRSVTGELENAYAAEKRILLEGTQGTDLSIHHGIYPSVTSRETTAAGCLADAGISPRRVDRIYMVTRTYPIRVGGTSGEMGIEIDSGTIAKRSGIPQAEIDATEVGTVSKKPRRIAEFSWDRVRRAAQLNGATEIVLTFADYIDRANRTAKSFDALTTDTKQMICDIERLTDLPVTLVAVGFGRDKIIDRRHLR